VPQNLVRRIGGPFHVRQVRYRLHGAATGSSSPVHQIVTGDREEPPGEGVGRSLEATHSSGCFDKHLCRHVLRLDPVSDPRQQIAEHRPVEAPIQASECFRVASPGPMDQGV
jgi:hypothetical protein